MFDDEAVITAGTDAGSAGADAGLDFDINDTGADDGAGAEKVETTVPETEQRPVVETQKPAEEPDVQDFAGHVSNRIRNLVKMSPDFGKALAANPKLRDAIEAPLRREAAYRDVFPTVAEAKAMRERFPNGLQDVQALQDDLKEVEEIDRLTYNRDPDGNYSGHGKLIDNIFSSDRNAAVSLFKTLPREWHRLDPASYNDVMGKIVGATLVGTGSWEQLVELRDHAAATKGMEGIVPALDKVLNRLSPFVTEKQQTAEDIARDRERQSWEKEKATTQQATQQQFDRTFGQENVKLQKEVIGQHRVMQKLATVKTLTPQKRADITEKVRVKMEQFLRNSPSFMRKLTAAYQSRNMEEAQKIQRQFWSQDWLLNRMVRDVLKVETPNLVQGNRAAVERRTGPVPVKKPAEKSSDNGKPTAPFKENGVWYNANGSRMSTVEAMKHAMAQP
jgi:hypothetical protein